MSPPESDLDQTRSSGKRKMTGGERNDGHGLHQLGLPCDYASIASTAESPLKLENLPEAKGPSCS
jgi:hypothetical protein